LSGRLSYPPPLVPSRALHRASFVLAGLTLFAMLMLLASTGWLGWEWTALALLPALLPLLAGWALRSRWKRRQAAYAEHQQRAEAVLADRS
jgi:uncharacterized membrane protein YdbT with pleckstrin-like domain